MIEGRGALSDSLSKVYGGVVIFEHNRQYYRINSLADYYFWFTRKYEFLFRKDIHIYERIYYEGNSFRLAKYVKENYKGKKLPVKFRFPNSPEFRYSEPPMTLDSGGPPTITRPHFLGDH